MEIKNIQIIQNKAINAGTFYIDTTTTSPPPPRVDPVDMA